jgi:hypothetical protein
MLRTGWLIAKVFARNQEGKPLMKDVAQTAYHIREDAFQLLPHQRCHL